jgi:AAA domain/Transcriptional regulator, AbiEi antitoxin
MSGWPFTDSADFDAAVVDGTPDSSPLLAGLRNGAWLDAQDFPPLRYSVPGIIPEGSVLLVGPPKVGKSWLVLSIALAAAATGNALGLDIDKRPVLYLALEDGDRRMQDRCRRLLCGDPIPQAFEYLTRVEHGRILDTVAAWLDLHGDPALGILDTLGKVMPPALNGESAYQRDYRVGGQLKQLADGHPGTTVLVNHHDRKADADDFVDSVSGTHGLAGAADAIVVLTRPRLQEDGLVKVTGRDIPEGEYAVRFRDGHHWALHGDGLAAAAEVARSVRATAGLGDRAADIVEAVTRLGQATASDVVAEVGIDRAKVDVYLGRLVDSGRLERIKRGVYAPTPPVRSVGTVSSNKDDPTEPNASNTSNGSLGGD